MVMLLRSRVRTSPDQTLSRYSTMFSISFDEYSPFTYGRSSSSHLSFSLDYISCLPRSSQWPHLVMSINAPLTPINPTAPTLPGTPSTGVSTQTTTAPPRHGGLERKYVISPHKLFAKHCSCNNPSRRLITANEIIENMHGRLSKVIGRLTHGGKVAREVHDAFTRVLLELRGRGEELFHLVGWEDPTQDSGERTRREFSVVLMIPDPEEPSRHRVLAEIMIHCRGNGRHAGTIENVAVRYAEDWEDWTVVMNSDYLRDSSAPEPEKVILGEEGTMTGKQVIDKVWKAVVGFIQHPTPGLKSDFAQRMGRAVERLNGDGYLLSAFSVEMGYRAKTGSKSKTAPAIRIALYAKIVDNETSVDESLERLRISGASDKVSERRQTAGPGIPSVKVDLDDEDHIAAVILIDLSTPFGGSSKVKHIAVIYEGEWPITHHYRRTIPAPDLGGLKSLLIVEQAGEALSHPGKL